MTRSQVVDGYKAAINSYRVRQSRKEALEVFRRSQPTKLSDDDLAVLNATLNTILELMDAGFDAIWVFMLSNIYAPITLAQSKFNMLVGNPPWIAMRYVENMNYQDFLKQEVLSYELLSSGQVHQFSNTEAATLFFCKSSDIYLSEEGIISFVMPRSVLTGALHHANFKQLKKPKMKLVRILDLEDVSPLFNVPSCVLMASKGKATSYPVAARKFAGDLPEKNVRLFEAKRYLLAKDYMYSPPPPLETYSVYYDQVKSGAYFCPRCFYFIDFDIHQILGICMHALGTVTIKPVDFLAENATQILATNDLMEAHYLCSLLNSNIINEMIKPYQPRGSFGERDITRLPFKLPLEKFDKNNPLHGNLAKMSERCHSIAASFKFTKKGTSGLRAEAREIVFREIKDIDTLVSKLVRP